MEILAGSVHKTEEHNLKNKTLAALFVVIPTHYLFVEMCDLIQINIRCTSKGCQHKKLVSGQKKQFTDVLQNSKTPTKLYNNNNNRTE